jgi:hypothetical protein
MSNKNRFCVDYYTSLSLLCRLVGTAVKVVPNFGPSFFLTACMVFNIIIIGVIQGSLFTNFSTTIFYADIKTLQELDESELPIAVMLWHLIKPIQI